MSWTGGCQCGAVRFRVEGDLGAAGVCCCRMCQKAFAAPYGALVSVAEDRVTWTRGARRRFQSSNRVARGFCGDCGTPLSFEPGGGVIDLAICAFDRAAEIAPTSRLRTDAALPWTGVVDELPARTADAEPASRRMTRPSSPTSTRITTRRIGPNPSLDGGDRPRSGQGEEVAIKPGAWRSCPTLPRPARLRRAFPPHQGRD